MKRIINTGLVGFGLSGRVFHAPFVETNPDFHLHTIVSSGTEAKKLYPNARILTSFEDLIADPEIDLVVICTPHQMHAEQAVKAMEAGKHVVIEKPVAMSSEEIEQLIQTAKITRKIIFPYHNRRWDGDFLTLRHIINEGYLGEVIDFESHFDRYQILVSRAEWRYAQKDGGGTLFDLGPHLIDQAICLFGSPRDVSCLLYFQREGSKANDSFDLKLIYPKVTATLRAGVFVKETGPRFQVHGTLGSYIKYGLDTQEAALKNGVIPGSKNFGVEPKKNHGLLHSVAKEKTLRLHYPSFPGHYMGFYEDVYAALTGKKQPEIVAEKALLNLKIIEAALMSHFEKRIINLSV
jgi:scyllo-inositol 2-dehydrogenase (NADP+)